MHVYNIFCTLCNIINRMRPRPQAHEGSVLISNGALVLFSQDPYTSKLITDTHGNLPFSYRYTWKKDHFANSLIAKKAPVNYTEDVCVFFKKYDTLNQHPLREYSRKLMSDNKTNLKKINADLGHRRFEHFAYTDSTQFGLCTEKTYLQYIFFGKPIQYDGYLTLDFQKKKLPGIPA